MSVLTGTQKKTSTPAQTAGFRIRTLLDVLSLVAMSAAFLLLIVYLVMAIRWQNQPFIGAMFTESLTVTDARSFTGEEWPALEAGLEPGDTITGINGQEWGAENPVQAFQDALADMKKGQTVTLSVSRKGESTPENWQCAAPVDGESFCTVSNVKLITLPVADFLLHFGVGYGVAVLVLLVGLAVLWLRFGSPPAMSFAVSAAALAVLVAGRFDLMTTFDLIPAWMIAGFVFSSVLLMFALVFPVNLPVLYRAPQSLRFAPLVVGTLLTGLTLWLYYEDQSSTTLLLIPLLTVLTSVGILMLAMFWRRIYSTSPVIHEQASFISLGTLVAFAPLLIWVVYFLVTGGNILNELTPVVQVAVLFYTLSTAYAVLQYRLLQTDRIIPEFLVYSGLTALLLIGYLLVTVALGIGAVEILEADSPILIALTIGVIVALFGPARNYLRQSIDEVMFRQRRNYQQRLESLSRQLTTAASLDDIFTAVKDELEATLAPADVLMFLFDNKTGGYTAWPDPRTGKAGTDIIFRADGGLMQYLSQEQSTLYLEPGQPLPMTVVSDRSQLAVLGMPLFVRLQGRDRLNGVLCIGARRNGDAYSYEDLRFIENLTDQMAVAVDRAKFVNDLEHRVRIQDVLSQVSHALNYAIDFDTLLELIFAQTLRIIDADHFYIVLRDQATDELYYSFYSTRDERLYYIENKRWKMGRDVLSEVVRRQISKRLENFTSEQLKREPRLTANLPDIYAWIGVPLITDTASGGALGVMAIGASDPGITFTDEQMQLFTDIANIAASAIDKTQLFKKTEIRAAQLKALNDISGLLASELEDVDRLLEIITESAVSILGCEAGSLLLVDERTHDLVFRVATGGKGSELIGQRISRNEPSLVAEAVSKVQPIIVNNPAQDARWHGDLVDTNLAEEQGFKSRAILTVPLVAQGEAVGALQVINKRDGSPFTDEDAELANTFAGQAAVAIQNARLFELQDQQLLLRVQELEGMAAIDHSLNRTIVLDELTDTVMGWALERTGATHGAIFLIENDVVRLIASYGYPEQGSIFSLPPGKSRDLSENEIGILKRVIATGTPSMTTDVKNDPHYVESLPGCVAQAAVPLVSGAEVSGAILIETTEPGKLGLLELNFLSRLADRASSAISNATLYTQLSAGQKARVNFVRFMAHELMNSITPMKGYMGLVLRGVVGELNPQQSNFLKTVSNNIETMEHLINDMRDVEMISGGQVLNYKLESVDFNEVLSEVLANTQPGFETKEQMVQVNVPEELPEVWVDKVRLKQVLTNFLTNANKYTPEEGEVEIFAEIARNEWDPDGARRVLHIGVRDTGLGISKEDQKRLFQPYFRSTNPKAYEEQKGTGLGLTLTRSLIEQQGGKIWLESDLGKGSTFHFTIPLASEVLTERA